MKKIITLLLILCMSFTVVACGSSDTSVDGTSETNSPVEETATEESVDEKIEILGDTIKIADLDENDKGKTISFVATYWSEVTGAYNYHFSYYEEGAEFAYAFEIKDETDNEDLSFLLQHNHEDNIAMQMTAVFDGVEEGKQQNFYRFTVKEATQVDSNLAQQTVNDNRYRVGDSITFTNGLVFNVTAADVYIDSNGNSFLHVGAEMENVSDEKMVFYSNQMSFYNGDDYLIEDDNFESPKPMVDDALLDIEIAPGRKAKGGFYQYCPEHATYPVIEAQILDAVIVVKDENLSINVVTGNDTGNTSEGNLAGMGYTGDFINSTGDTMLYLTEFDVPNPDGALGNVWIYQGENMLVDTPYYLETSGTSCWEDWGYERLYYFGDDQGDIYFLGVSSAGEGVVVDYNSIDRNIDYFSLCTG